MEALNFSLFTSAVKDLESAQYRVLAGLQRVRTAFASNIIYPHLGELIELYRSLQTVIQRSDDLKKGLPGRIKGVNLAKKEVVYEWPELDRDDIAQVRELIHWSLPRIQDAIEEGRSMYEFVEEHLHLEEVGLVPSYVQEGYLIVPDRQEHTLYILQYSLSIFTSADSTYRSLKTEHLKSLPQGLVDASPQDIKMMLLSERRELPNPATYSFNTDLSFPFEPTIFPIAKRKLMQHLFDQGATA